MQRLPPNRIQRADKAGEIDLQEHPTPARLCTGDDPALGARANLFGVHVQEGRRFLKVQRATDQGKGGKRGRCVVTVRKIRGRWVVGIVDVHVKP